jgi:serine/threonine protein kinase
MVADGFWCGPGARVAGGRQVALKIMDFRLDGEKDFRLRFLRESRAVAVVDHPNVIPIYQAGESDGALFIAMRYVRGGDVRRLLDSGPLTPELAMSIITPVANALDAAHEVGLVHRDVKPANMLLETPEWREPRIPHGLRHSVVQAR